MVIWNIEDGFNSDRDISAVVKFVFIWDFGVAKMLIEHFVFILGHFSFFLVPNSLEIVDNITI